MWTRYFHWRFWVGGCGESMFDWTAYTYKTRSVKVFILHYVHKWREYTHSMTHALTTTDTPSICIILETLRISVAALAFAPFLFVCLFESTGWEFLFPLYVPETFIILFNMNYKVSQPRYQSPMHIHQCLVQWEKKTVFTWHLVCNLLPAEHWTKLFKACHMTFDDKKKNNAIKNFKLLVPIRRKYYAMHHICTQKKGILDI